MHNIIIPGTSLGRQQSIDTPEGYEAQDLALANRMKDVLDAHYPGHMWLVRVQHKQGVAIIRNLSLRDRNGLQGIGAKMGMVRHIDQIRPDLKDVVRAGGELLERWGIPRGRFAEETGYYARPQFNDIRLPGERVR